MKNKNSKTVLITGATSGFGLEFARIFARHGYDLILTARNEKNLKKIAAELKSRYSAHIYYFGTDLSKPRAAEALYNWTVSKKLKVGCLINNAGIGNYGRFIDIALDKERELLELNIVVLTELCHKFIPDMIRRGGGKILNVASIAAFQAGAFYATYFASKAYVLLFSEALAEEYNEDNITVSALCPGPSRTRFFEKAKMTTKSLLLRASFLDPRAVAEAGFRGLMRGDIIITPGLRYKLLSKSYRILPRTIIARITKILIETAAMVKSN